MVGKSSRHKSIRSSGYSLGGSNESGKSHESHGDAVLGQQLRDSTKRVTVTWRHGHRSQCQDLDEKQASLTSYATRGLWCVLYNAGYYLLYANRKAVEWVVL